MFFQKRVEWPKNKTLVIGIVERGGGGQVVKIGLGEYIRKQEVGGRYREFVKVKWNDGSVEEFVVPSFKDVFHVVGGGSVVFFYIPEPGIGIPVRGVEDAIKRIYFDDEKEAKEFVEQLYHYNPGLKIDITYDEEHKRYVVEFPVKSFDLNRDVPFRQSFAEQLSRVYKHYRTWWEKYGTTAASIGLSILTIIAFFIATNFISGLFDKFDKTIQKMDNYMAKITEMQKELLQRVDKVLDTSNKLLKVISETEVRSGEKVPAPPPA